MEIPDVILNRSYDAIGTIRIRKRRSREVTEESNCIYQDLVPSYPDSSLIFTTENDRTRTMLTTITNCCSCNCRCSMSSDSLTDCCRLNNVSQPLPHYCNHAGSSLPISSHLLPRTRRSSTNNRIRIPSFFFYSLLFILALQIFSHQLFCTATSPKTSSEESFQPSDTIEIERLLRGNSHNKNKIQQTPVNNKVFHHNRTTVFTTTTKRTTAINSSSSKAKGKGGKLRNRPNNKKPNINQRPTKKGRPVKNRANNSKELAQNSNYTVPPRDPNNRPKYMKKIPQPAPGQPPSTYYLSTIQIPSSATTTTIAPFSNSNINRPLSLPLAWSWTPPEPKDNWKGLNRQPFRHPGFSFSTSTSRSLNPIQTFQSGFQPSAVDSLLDPLSVLKADIQSSTTTTTRTEKDLENNDYDFPLRGRSSIEVEKIRSPVYERPKTKIPDMNSTKIPFSSSNGITSGKNLKYNFFDNFEDHWDDPIADETRGTGPVITAPDPTSSLTAAEDDLKPSALPASATGSTGYGTGSSSSVETTGTGSTGTTGQSSAGPAIGKHGYLNPPTLQNYPPYYHFPLQPHHQKPNYFAAHKDANYWPQKLNSYYGEHVTSQVLKHQQLLKQKQEHQNQQKQQQGSAPGNFRRPLPHPAGAPNQRLPPALLPRRPPSPFLQGRNPHRVAKLPPLKNGSPIPHPAIKHQLTQGPNIHQHQKLQNSFPFQYMSDPFSTGPPQLIGTNSLEEEEGEKKQQHNEGLLKSRPSLISAHPTGPSPTKSTAAGLDQQNSGSELYLTGSDSNQKASVIDRMSTFYTEYKLLAWGGILLLISLGVLGAISVLYMNNPPTEVVTAKRSLIDKLTDPSMLKLLENLLGDEETGFNSKSLNLGLEIVRQGVLTGLLGPSSLGVASSSSPATTIIAEKDKDVSEEAQTTTIMPISTFTTTVRSQSIESSKEKPRRKRLK